MVTTNSALQRACTGTEPNLTGKQLLILKAYQAGTESTKGWGRKLPNIETFACALVRKVLFKNVHVIDCAVLSTENPRGITPSGTYACWEIEEFGVGTREW